MYWLRLTAGNMLQQMSSHERLTLWSCKKAVIKKGFVTIVIIVEIDLSMWAKDVF